MTSTLKRLAGKQVALYLSMSVEEDRYRAFFRFETSNQPEDVAERLHNRRACSALQGIGGWATNKQSAKSKTFAQLATICLPPRTDNSVLVPICFGVVLLMGVGGDDSWGARTHEEYLIDISPCGS